MNQGASEVPQPAVPLLLCLPYPSPATSLSVSTSLLSISLSISPPTLHRGHSLLRGQLLKVDRIHFQRDGLGTEHAAPGRPWSQTCEAALDDRWQRCWN